MSFGKISRCFCTVKRITKTEDEDGFSCPVESSVLENVRCYREGRHGSEKWANLSTFSTVTDLFRLRADPDVRITTSDIIYCGDERFRIFSVENVRGKGMYTEILAEKVESSVG